MSRRGEDGRGARGSGERPRPSGQRDDGDVRRLRASDALAGSAEPVVPGSDRTRRYHSGSVTEREAEEIRRRAAAACPYIDDDWAECHVALEPLRVTQIQAVVAWLLSWMRSRTQIADITRMPESTVNFHVSHLRDKLGVPDWRDVGARTRHLVNVLRAREARRDRPAAARGAALKPVKQKQAPANPPVGPA